MELIGGGGRDNGQGPAELDRFRKWRQRGRKDWGEGRGYDGAGNCVLAVS